MAWLLDTNVLSEIRRPRPEQRVVQFLSQIPEEDLFVSVVTLAEFRFGIELIEEAARRSRLILWLNETVRPMFAGRVMGLDEEVLLRWRLLAEVGRKAGYTFSQPDLLIAAIAAKHGLTVVSRDTTPFEKAGVPVFNPWHWSGH
jgi:hypothetical protein